MISSILVRSMATPVRPLQAAALRATVLVRHRSDLNITPAPPAPKRARTAYMLYTEDYFEQMQKDKLAGRPTDPSFAAVGPAWKSLSAAQKKVYDDRAAVLKSKVAAEVAEYHAKYTPLQLAARKQIDLAKSAAKAETSLAREVRIAGGDPARVKRPPTGYQLFVRETAKSHKGAKIGEISSAASAAWKELTEAEKAAWAARAETEVLKAAKF